MVFLLSIRLVPTRRLVGLFQGLGLRWNRKIGRFEGMAFITGNKKIERKETPIKREP
jgi:hypothetical protein